MFLACVANAGGNGDDGYTLSLKELIRQSEENIEKVDSKIANKKIEKKNEEREAIARAYFEKGNTLYKQGKLKEARGQWQKALDLTSHPEMKDYIRQSDRKAKQQMKIQKVKTNKPAVEVKRGCDLTPANQNSKDIKKTKPKTETPEVKRGCVFQGSSLFVNDVKETQDKPKNIIKPKKAKTKPKIETAKKRWWQCEDGYESKKQKSEDNEIKRGCTFEGSSLVVNEVKEDKKDKSKNIKVKKTKPKVKKETPARKISKPKLQKEEKQPPQRGYDIFSK